MSTSFSTSKRVLVGKEDEGARGNQCISLAFVIEGEVLGERRFDSDGSWPRNEALNRKQCDRSVHNERILREKDLAAVKRCDMHADQVRLNARGPSSDRDPQGRGQPAARRMPWWN